jgi:hypothetical protein
MPNPPFPCSHPQIQTSCLYKVAFRNRFMAENCFEHRTDVIPPALYFPTPSDLPLLLLCIIIQPFPTDVLVPYMHQLGSLGNFVLAPQV